jgi:CubicO group peptidase (beta-lactamase class C family)
MDRTVRAQADSGFSGVVLVAVNGSVLLRRAYAAHHQRLRPNSPFWIASMTKGFTAAAILRLQAEGRLKVTDSIGRFIANAPRDKAGITIHQLLTHTAGLGGEYTGGGITERSRAVHAILSQDLIFQPGRGYKYGDDDYELLAAIIEIASEKKWEDYLRTRFLVPLHLKSVGFACENPPFSKPVCDWGHKGANGMFASADDILRWSRWLITNAAMNEMGRPQILVRKDPPYDVSYGYGVRIYTLNGKVVEIMHSGSGDNEHTSIVRNLGNGLTIIVLSNAGQHEGTTWASFVAHRLVDSRPFQ